MKFIYTFQFPKEKDDHDDDDNDDDERRHYDDNNDYNDGMKEEPQPKSNRVL